MTQNASTGRLAGKVAIVTGAAQGIGEAIARAFADAGAAVVIADINEAGGKAVARSIGEAGGAAVSVRADVTNADDIGTIIARTHEAFGPPTTLVNNAGANVFYEPLHMPEAEWRRCFDLDLNACWHTARAVLPSFLEAGGGSIVNIASAHSFQIIPHTFPYPVAKHALLGLTRALGIEYAAQGIRVNAIAPGYIETPIATAYWATFDDPSAERRRAEALHPPGRIGTPREVAMTALFLASDEAPFINAEMIVIDGGRSVLYHD